MKKIAFTILSTSILLSCGEEKKENKKPKEEQNKVSEIVDTSSTYQMNPTTFNFDEDTEYRKVNAGIGSMLSLASGTTVSIPSDCFVKQNGDKVTGEVDVDYKEYLTAGDIIASKIPMTYDSAGVVSDFESAGMFEINAYQNGEKLEIAPDKSIAVNLASPKEGDNFNFYHLKDRDSNWDYIATPKSEKVVDEERLAEIEKKLDSLKKPNVPLKYDPSGNYYDLNIDYQKFSTYKPLMGVLWQYEGTKKSEDPFKKKTFFTREWYYVSILPIEDENGAYSMTLMDDDTTIRTIARPVYRGKLLTEANAEFNKNLAKFNQQMAQAKNQMEQLENEAGIMRVFSVKKMGIYNYDRQYKYGNMVPLLASFDFGDPNANNYPVSVFLVTGNGMAVVKYVPNTYEKFKFNPDDDNKMIAILPENKICTYSQNKFNDIDYSGMNKEVSNPFTFNMDISDDKISGPKDLDRIIQNL